MTDNGFLFPDLIDLQRAWSSKAISDVVDSYGQEWVSYNFLCNILFTTTGRCSKIDRRPNVGFIFCFVNFN